MIERVEGPESVVFGIRHGTSTHNEAIKIGYANNNKLEVRFSEEYMDPPLNASGIEQARELGEKGIITDLNVSRIYVSPFTRTLQTVEHILSASPTPLAPLHVKVCPQLRELLCCTADIPAAILHNILHYGQLGYDFTLLLDQEGINRELFYLLDMDMETKDNIFQIIHTKHPQEGDSLWKHKIVLNYAKNSDRKYLEEWKNIRTRIANFKEFLKKDLETLEAGSSALVVAHYTVLEYLTAQNFDANSEPTDGIRFKNCQLSPIATNL